MRPNGVIYITNSDDKNLLTSDSLFSNSLSSNYGGSIYVENGACIQYHVCSINSSLSADKDGCHSYVGTNEENFVIESSISQCKGYNAALSLWNGKQSIDSTNISYAKCVINSACVCAFPSNHMINFTSIFNNTADRQCIMFHIESTQFIYKCKVIQNEHKKIDYRYGIIYNPGCDLTVSFCIFSLNIGPSLFSNSNYNKFVVDKCYIDSNNKVDGPASGNPVALDTINSLEFNLRHLSTQDCYADFPIFITSFREKTIFFESNPFEKIFLMFYGFINS